MTEKDKQKKDVFQQTKELIDIHTIFLCDLCNLLDNVRLALRAWNESRDTSSVQSRDTTGDTIKKENDM